MTTQEFTGFVAEQINADMQFDLGEPWRVRIDGNRLEMLKVRGGEPTGETAGFITVNDDRTVTSQLADNAPEFDLDDLVGYVRSRTRRC